MAKFFDSAITYSGLWDRNKTPATAVRSRSGQNGVLRSQEVHQMHGRFKVSKGLWTTPWKERALSGSGNGTNSGIGFGWEHAPAADKDHHKTARWLFLDFPPLCSIYVRKHTKKSKYQSQPKALHIAVSALPLERSWKQKWSLPWQKAVT